MSSKEHADTLLISSNSVLLVSWVKNLVSVRDCRELPHYHCDLQEQITPGCFELPPNIPRLGRSACWALFSYSCVHHNIWPCIAEKQCQRWWSKSLSLLVVWISLHQYLGWLRYRLVAPDILSVIGEVARGQVSLTIALIWMVALIVTFLPKFPGVSDKPFLAFFDGFVLLVTLIIAVTYYKIFKITSKSIREHRTNSDFAGKVVRLSFVAALEPRLCHYLDKRQTDRDTRVQKEERKAAGTIAFVIGAFIILVYPHIFLILYHFATPETTKSQQARFWIWILLYSNFVANPPLYAWRHNEFKRNFRNVFLKCWRCCLRQKLKLLRKSSSNKTFSTHSLPRNEAHAGNDENGQNTHSVEEVNRKLLKIPWKLYQWSPKLFTRFLFVR